LKLLQLVKIKQKLCNIKIYFSHSFYNVYFIILKIFFSTFLARKKMQNAMGNNIFYSENRLKIILLEYIAMQKNEKSSQHENLKK